MTGHHYKHVWQKHFVIYIAWTQHEAWTLCACLLSLPSLYRYACMPTPMCLALCTVMCVLCISVHYSHYYFLCILSLLPLHIHHASLHVLFTVHTWPRSYSYTLTMVDKGLEILCWVLTDISWCVKCSKLHCLGFLTAVKTVLFPVLLDLKVSQVWRPERFPKDQIHPDSELEL